ncbi:MAG TPA: condensation domain-containing protein, partial [Candidatus Angelobacter sp.]|nr:condensation domain-containing protein [Candidatus Angelobacter sp.]
MSDSENTAFSSAARTRQLVSALLRKKRVGTEENESIPARPVYSPCPASFAQQRLWLIDQMSKDSRYNLQVSLRLEERLELGALRDAWREILGRHESLRTTFAVIDEQIMQFISPDLQPPLGVMDLSGENVSDPASRIRGVLEQQGQQGFDLAHGPLVRPLILKIQPEEYILCFTMHHIISDGWSLTVLVREFKELYAAFSQGRPSPLAPLAIQYADFAWWQRQRLTGDLLETHLGYWRKQLHGAPVLDLPADRPRPRKESFTGSQWYFAIPEELTGRLRELG